MNNSGAQFGETKIDSGDVRDVTIQQAGGDIVAGDKTTIDRNVNILGNLVIYLSSRPEEPAAQPTKTEIGPNPYKGLSAFSENDVDRFFGRETLIGQLWERYRDLHELSPTRVEGKIRLLAIIGPSGSGKSSVARAGLLPELARRPLPGRQRARVVVLTPGSHPIRSLAAILARIATNDPTPVAKTREFEGELRMTSRLRSTSGATPTSVISDIERSRDVEGFDGLSRIAAVLPDIVTAPLVILVDQFEEVYSLCQDVEERGCMINNLLTAAADSAGHVSVILTLRSDFLGHTQSHPDLNHAIAAQGVIVPVMNDAELRQAIAKPAELAGHPLEAATIDLLIAQSAGREGALPLLQFALTRIWEGLAAGVAPAETLQRIGGVGGALAGEAQRLYDKLTDADKAIARRAFLALVQLGEGVQDTRRRAAVPEMIAHGEDPDHVAEVLRVFAQPGARLVSLSADPQSGVTAEVTHEALLAHWTSLKDWLDNSRDDLRFQRHVAEDAQYWRKQGQPEGLLWRPPDLDLLRKFHARAGKDMTPIQIQFFQASARREQHAQWIKRGAIAALLIFAALTGIAAYFAVLSRNEARKQEQAAVYRYQVSFVQSLVMYAEQHLREGKREQSALLARQIHFLNQTYKSNIDDQIRDVLRRALALPKAETAELLEQVCQQARRNLTPAEWQNVVKSAQIACQPCPDLPGADGAAELVLRLRSEPLTTEEVQHLSLYVKADSYVGTFIDNRFEAQAEGKVIVDRATGLMWQQSGSEKKLTYEDAQTYVERLKAEKFAGYDDWRLPTVEELLSLVESERQSNDLRINPVFDKRQSWCWSIDKSSPESAWIVNFSFGDVNWSNLRNSGYVRAVRF